MSSKDSAAKDRYKWHKYAQIYDPIRVGSIDGTDTEPHDRAIVRALRSRYKPPQFLANSDGRPTATAPCAGEARHTVFIARLHPDTDETELRQAIADRCSAHDDGGTASTVRIRDLRLVRDIRTGASRRYAFVVFGSSRTAQRVIDTMHGTQVRGQRILATEECERTLPGWRPRRLGGGFGGRKESGQLRFGCVDRPFQRPLEAGRMSTKRSGQQRSDSNSSSREKHRKRT